jgi:hypothetical protein
MKPPILDLLLTKLIYEALHIYRKIINAVKRRNKDQQPVKPQVFLSKQARKNLKAPAIRRRPRQGIKTVCFREQLPTSGAMHERESVLQTRGFE